MSKFKGRFFLLLRAPAVCLAGRNLSPAKMVGGPRCFLDTNAIPPRSICGCLKAGCCRRRGRQDSTAPGQLSDGPQTPQPVEEFAESHWRGGAARKYAASQLSEQRARIAETSFDAIAIAVTARNNTNAHWPRLQSLHPIPGQLRNQALSRASPSLSSSPLRQLPASPRLPARHFISLVICSAT